MSKNFFDHIVHGGDYNPDQWVKTPEIWDEDMRLMKLAHINNATVGIFAWSMIEPEEHVYNFGWLDEIMDKLAANGQEIILATPSGARPAWLAEKYPEVLRVEKNGIRNEFGVRHNHCLTSPVYREKVREINTILAERYKNHPALKMWHISNEYSGECHCELCRQSFRKWLKNYYRNDIEELNDAWWGGFWSHKYNSFEQINPPSDRGESHVTALKLCWKRFVTDSHISFFENETAPLRTVTPDIPITTNFMRMYDGIDYQRFANYVDIVSWDNYPAWDKNNNNEVAAETAFVHDAFRTMKGGQPFLLMESTPSIPNWQDVNKIPKPGRSELSSIQAIAHGADSVQYFQWRKSRGSHEKYHGAVVDHCGHENTRVFREIAHTGEVLEKLGGAVGTRSEAKIAIMYDWENAWAVKFYCGYNNLYRNYLQECIKWYKPFYERGICADIISEDDDYSKYDLIIAPYLYMLKDGVEAKIADYVENGGKFAATYLTGVVDKNDLCCLGGVPAGKLKDVFGVWCEETDSLPDGMENSVIYNGRHYSVDHICDIIHLNGSENLAQYEKDFYAGEPAAAENKYGKGTAYYIAFRNDGDFADDFCEKLIKDAALLPDCRITADKGVEIRKRGDYIFVLNFADGDVNVALDKEYADVVNGGTVSENVTLKECGYMVLKEI